MIHKQERTMVEYFAKFTKSETVKQLILRLSS